METALLQKGRSILSLEEVDNKQRKEILRKMVLCLKKLRKKNEPRQLVKPTAKESAQIS